MRKTVFCYLLTAIGTILFFSCQREIDWNIPEADPNSLVASPVKVSVTGLIVDENDQPFSNVTVKAGVSNVAITDSKGYFRFNNISLDKFASLISAETPGYFKGYRIFSASSKGTNFIKIQLLKKVSIGTINSTLGGSVNAGGYSITLPANGVIVKSSGIGYTGNITVFAQPIDPTVANISAIVPGSFLGIDSLNRRVILESFGMIAVELQGSSGQSLQIANNKSAQIEFAIPASKLSKAPTNIPLWYVDESTGIWKQEGNAIKNGSVYTGAVKHFSFWNCDHGISNLVYLEMTIKNNAGYPIPHALVKISRNILTGVQGESYGYTDSVGHVGGLVPANEILILDVLNDCYTSAHTRTIGPFTQNSNLGDLGVSLGASEVQINGVIKNCSGQNITNGWISIYAENKYYNIPVNINGQFNVSITHCNNNNITIVAGDNSTTQVSPIYNYTIGVSILTNLQLIACGSTFYTVTTLAGDRQQLAGYLDGIGPAARFNDPMGTAIDANGNVFVADKNNHCIRKITPAGVVTTFAGNGTAGYADGIGVNARFNLPVGLAFDASGNLIVVDQSNCRIRKITPAGVVTTIAGDGNSMHLDGPALSASFSGPQMIAIDQAGNMYITEFGNNDIRKITTAGMVTTLAGDALSVGGYADGLGTAARFNFPIGIVVDASGNLYVAELVNRRIRKITPVGLVSTIAGDGSSGFLDGPGVSAKFAAPFGIAIDNNGDIFIADRDNYKIRKIIISSGVVSTFGGSSPGSLDGPIQLAQFGEIKGITYLNGTFALADTWNAIRIIKQ